MKLQAQRIKPHAIDIRPKVDPVHWFLHDKDDVRSSYHLEDVGTEFLVQGLELDWACVVLGRRPAPWQDRLATRRIRRHPLEPHPQSPTPALSENAYRVLLTRARQGMVIVEPEGDLNDPTRRPELYDAMCELLGGDRGGDIAGVRRRSHIAQRHK